MAFNKKEYDKKYHKENRSEKKIWLVELPKDEKEKYDNMLKEKNITKIQFLRNSFKELKEKE